MLLADTNPESLTGGCGYTGERIGKLIRNAEKAKVPLMCVVGTKEADAASLSVRTYGPQGGELGMLPITEVTDRLLAATASQGSF